MFRWIAVLIALLVASPVQAKKMESMTEADWAKHFFVRSDPFRSLSEFGAATWSDGVFMGPRVTWAIRGWFSKDETAIEKVRFQYYFNVVYRGDWEFIDAAYFLGGEQGEVTQISRDVLSCSGYLFGCSHSETVGVMLPYERIALALRDKQPLSIQLAGKTWRGSFVVPYLYLKVMYDELVRRTALRAPPPPPSPPLVPLEGPMKVQSEPLVNENGLPK